MNKKVILTILDGWGISPTQNGSAVDAANTPFIDQLYTKYPHAKLRTDGANVGLPEGQMGNSEVGHMNLGAGRVVYQDLVKINMAVEKDTLKNEPVLEQTFNYAKENNKAVHFIGLVSDGGVHSHINHLEGLVKAADDFGIDEKYIHAFTDGRDVDPHSGKGFISDVLDFSKTYNTKLSSIIGRYYAMDRDKRWERVAKTYHLLTNAEAETYTDHPLEAIDKSYKNDVSDEFIKPIKVNLDDAKNGKIEKEDVVIFFNFRTDRGRQLTQALSQENFAEHQMKSLSLYFVTMTQYDDRFKSINVVYKKEHIKATLGEVLEYTGKSQIRAAETEKYPHVTFFFSGGREKAFRDEKRILVNSPKVATYDLQPEMSAYELRDKLIPEIKDQTADFMCVNFANADMVGHTGDFDAAVKACETVDECLSTLVGAAEEENYSMLIIADHGNSETMINSNGSPNTAHTTNPVPLILVDKDVTQIKDGVLGDIAPTVLELMGVDKPKLMTQKSLIS